MIRVTVQQPKRREPTWQGRRYFGSEFSSQPFDVRGSVYVQIGNQHFGINSEMFSVLLPKLCWLVPFDVSFLRGSGAIPEWMSSLFIISVFIRRQWEAADKYWFVCWLCVSAVRTPKKLMKHATKTTSETLALVLQSYTSPKPDIYGKTCLYTGSYCYRVLL